MNDKSLERMLRTVADWARSNVWGILLVSFLFWCKDGLPRDTDSMLSALEIGVLTYVLIQMARSWFREKIEALDRFDATISELKEGRGIRAEIRAFRKWRANRKDNG